MDQVGGGLLARVEVVIGKAAHGVGEASAVVIARSAFAEETQQRRAGRLDPGFLQRLFGVDEIGVWFGGARRS